MLFRHVNSTAKSLGTAVFLVKNPPDTALCRLPALSPAVLMATAGMGSDCTASLWV